jgi:hypothetical protein
MDESARQVSQDEQRWVTKYRKLAEADPKASKILRQTRKAGGYPEVVYELLYFHLRGDFGIAAGRNSWIAFTKQIKSFKSLSKKFLNELDNVSHRALFKLPPVPEAFLVLESSTRRFAWELRTGTAFQPWISDASNSVHSFLQLIDTWLTVGDQTWSQRDFQQRNLILLFLYVRAIRFPKINIKVKDRFWSEHDISYLIEVAHDVNGIPRAVSKKAIKQTLRRFAQQYGKVRRIDPSIGMYRKAWSFRDMSAIVLDFVSYSRRFASRTAPPSLLNFINQYYLEQFRKFGLPS